MIDVIAQYDGNAALTMWTEEDAEALQAEYRKHQCLRCKITTVGPVLAQSVEQNNLLHACFALVAENAESPNLRTKEAVKETCKVMIDFRDRGVVIVRPDGGVQFRYRSFSFDSLKGRERDQVIDQAMEWCADTMEITKGELVAEAQARMTRRKA